MRRLITTTLFLLAMASNTASAACHWGWYCKSGGADCGFVPFCDSPDDTPPPFQGVHPKAEKGAQPVDPSTLPPEGRRPLAGAKPQPGVPATNTEKP